MILSGGKQGKYDTMVKRLEKRYVDKTSYTYVKVYDPDYKNQTGLRYYLQNNMIAKLKSYDEGPLFLETEEFLKPYDATKLSLKNVFKSSAYKNLQPLTNPENEGEFEKIYFLFSCMYPFYLAKYGYNLENKANVFVGPYVVKQNKTDVQIDVNFNRKAMMTFAMETSYTKKSEGGGKDNNPQASSIQLSAVIAPNKPNENEIEDKKNGKGEKEDILEKEKEMEKEMGEYKDSMEKRFNEVLKEMNDLKGLFGNLRTKRGDNVDSGNQLSAIQEQIRELRDAQPFNNGEEEGKKKLYTILSQTSFNVWKTNKEMVIMVVAFLKADHDTRVRIIQGTFFNNSVSETLKDFFEEDEEGAKKKPPKKPPLLLKHFFGFPDKIKSSVLNQYRKVIKMATPQKSFLGKMFGRGPISAKRIQFSVKHKSKKAIFRKIRKKRGITRRNKSKRQNKIRKTKKKHIGNTLK
jgi:hypothetical protein